MANTDQRLTPVTEANGALDAGVVLVRAFNDLRDELISTLLFVLGNREDAQDAAQDAFVKCWSARDQVPGVVNLRAWIFRVSLNRAKDMQRSAWKRRMRPLRAALTFTTTPTSVGGSSPWRWI